MTFRREKIKDYFLLDTSVENLFINEYMAAAPGDFVKVYLFAQMYADLGQEITNEEIAKYLSMEHEDVLRAWTYWEKMGVIRKIRRESADQRFQCDAGGDRLRLCLLCQTQENKFQIYRSSDQWLDSERFSGRGCCRKILERSGQKKPYVQADLSGSRLFAQCDGAGAEDHGYVV